MLTARAYSNDDLALMPPRDQDREILELEKQLAGWRLFGPRFTIWDENDPIGAGGIIVVTEGVGEAWLRGTPRMEAHRLGFARLARRLFEAVMTEFKFYRVQAVTRCDLELNIRFAQWFGFELEGRLRQHEADRTDSFIWSRCS